MPSFTTLMTGLHPLRTGVVAHIGRHRLADDVQMLPQLAQEHGYVTMGVDNLVVQGQGRGSWFARGYDHYSGYLYKPFSNQSAQLVDRALSLTEEHADRPFFMFLHLWDPHTPYGPLPPYDTLHYEPGAVLTTDKMAEVRALHPEYYDAFLGDMKLAHPDDYGYVVAQYDGEISQVDAQIGRLVEGLKRCDAWENTELILLSDHGEAFGEGDFYFDHHGLYDAVIRVALMVRLPGERPRRIGALVSTEDVAPTLIELVGLPEPEYPLTGVSLTPLISGGASDVSVRKHVVSVESTRQASLSLRVGPPSNLKLILPIVEDLQGEPIPDYYGRPRNPDPLLFDLASDPGETHNVASERPDDLARLLAELEAQRAEMQRGTGLPDPVRSHGLTLTMDRFLTRLDERR